MNTESEGTLLIHEVRIITTIPGALAAVDGIEAMKKGQRTIRSLQKYHRDGRRI